MNQVILDEEEKAINQILLAYGTIEDSKLERFVKDIAKGFQNSNPRSLTESFGRINRNIRQLDLEIKTVVRLKCNECGALSNFRTPTCESCPSKELELVRQHGLANTEEDDVSKDHGTELLPEELKFFTLVVQSLVERHYLSTDDMKDIAKFKNLKEGEPPINPWLEPQTRNVLEKLNVNGWLQKDDRSYWEIGE